MTCRFKAPWAMRIYSNSFETFKILLKHNLNQVHSSTFKIWHTPSKYPYYTLFIGSCQNKSARLDTKYMIGMPTETSFSRIFENESSDWLREWGWGCHQKPSNFEARMRAINLRILKDSQKSAHERFWWHRGLGSYQKLGVHPFSFKQGFIEKNWKGAATNC